MESYLPAQISTLLLTDKNKDMLSVASLKAFRWSSLKGASHVSVGLRAMDAGNLEGVPDESFDSIVQTFGLCSVKDPSRVLNELKRVCKPDGSLLLLEHGRGHYDWLNTALDKTASGHANAWGCFWNRDIQGLIEQSGWVVEESQRSHLGTTHMYRLSKRDESHSANDVTR
jgi:ubiquinone/menaquinone biosynthesis C-methylase UbiE